MLLLSCCFQFHFWLVQIMLSTYLCFLLRTQTGLQNLPTIPWLWNGSNNYNNYETPQGFLLPSYILDYRLYGQSSILPCVIAMILDFTVVLIFVKLFNQFLFAYLSELLFLVWFLLFLLRSSITFFSKLIISVVCLFKFSQN